MIHQSEQQEIIKSKKPIRRLQPIFDDVFTPTKYERADSLREYSTGASYDGGTSAAPLGGFRSNYELNNLAMETISGIVGAIVEFVSSSNGEGTGVLQAHDHKTLNWRAPNDVPGARKVFRIGDTLVLESASDPAKFVRVRCEYPFQQSTSICNLFYRYNELFTDVSIANASAGITEYAGIILRNESRATLYNLRKEIGTLGTQQVSDVTQLSGSGSGTIATTGSFDDWTLSGWCRISNGEIVYYQSRTNTVLTVPANGRGRLGTSATAGNSADTLINVPGILVGWDSAGVQDSKNSIQTIASRTTAPTGITWITNAIDLQVNKQIGLWIRREIPVGAKCHPRLINLLDTHFEVEYGN